jgi:hypothetical protein
MLKYLIAVVFAQVVSRRVERSSRAKPRGVPWWLDSRNFVFLALGLLLGIGGGRKLWRDWKASRATRRLEQEGVSVSEVLESARFGRNALFELFRLLAEAPDAAIRDAAGRAIASLWKQDELVAEEEQALVKRGFSVAWRGRKRYPRDLKAPIPITVEYGVMFLRKNENEIGPDDLAWSHRITGARRASLETFHPWRNGPGSFEFEIHPTDFVGSGPHRLALETRVRTVFQENAWECELPKTAFTFELDPGLAAESLASTADDTRRAAFQEAVRLERTDRDGEDAEFLPLDSEVALRNPPKILVITPLPCDLAHRITIEIESKGSVEAFEAGSVVLGAQRRNADSNDRSELRFPLRIGENRVATQLEPGPARLRAKLVADLELAWGDPSIRSLWPESIVVDWIEAQIVRR